MSIQRKWYEIHATIISNKNLLTVSYRKDSYPVNEIWFDWVEISYGDKYSSVEECKSIIDLIKNNKIKECGLYDFNPQKVTNIYIVECEAVFSYKGIE